MLLIWSDLEIQTYRNCILFGMISGFVWEYLAPIINPNSVSDPIDLVCYFIGTTIYYLFFRNEILTKKVILVIADSRLWG